MASSLITSWQIDGETTETVIDFILGGSKITADGHCSHEIKRCLLLGRKVMANLDSMLKSRDITLPTKVHLVKAMAFPVVMYDSATPWTVTSQALSMGFCRQEDWRGLPFPPPRDLPHPGIEPLSLAPPASPGIFFTTVPPGKCF